MGWRLIVAISVAATLLTVSFAKSERAGAITPAPPDFYGIAPSSPLEASDFQRFARANIRTLRNTMYWPVIQRGAGRQYAWNAYDGAVINASYAGLTLLPTLLGSPAHISDNPFRPPLDTDAERREWQDFVRAAVARYGPGGTFWEEVYACNGGHCHPDLPYRPLRIWQVWNEPNLGIFWQPSPSPDEYAELLRLAGDAIHEADPGAEVITGGIMPGGPGAKNSIGQNDFIARLYQAPGITESFDGLDIHPYRRKPRQVRRMVADARALTQVFGDGGTPLWISEVGWSTHGPRDDDQVTSRKGQAKRLSKTFKMLTAMREPYGIRLASWFRYQDGEFGGYCKWCPGAGLFDRKGKAKPAWKKYVKVTGGER